jgi:hypothetical protein
MTTTKHEIDAGKPLGDGGTGATGGASIGNLEGAPATGGDARQGVRHADAPRKSTSTDKDHEPESVAAPRRRAGNPYSGKSPSSQDSDESEGTDEHGTQTATEAALPSTQDKNPKQ